MNPGPSGTVMCSASIKKKKKKKSPQLSKVTAPVLFILLVLFECNIKLKTADMMS